MKRKVKIFFHQLMFFKESLEKFNELAEKDNLITNAKIVMILEKNSEEIYKCFWQFNQKRNELVDSYSEKDENGNVKYTLIDKTKGDIQSNQKIVFSNENEYYLKLNKLLEEKCELYFYYDVRIYKTLDKIQGNHSLIKALCQLLNLFENYGK